MQALSFNITILVIGKCRFSVIHKIESKICNTVVLLLNAAYATITYSEGVFVQDTWLSPDWVNCTSPHLDLIAAIKQKSHHAGGKRGMLRTEATASFSSILKPGRVGLYQLLEKPPVWESLSSANGRQTPRRVVEIAWKRLKRDPDTVVSLAFHCSWQIQEGTLLMKTLTNHLMLMKTNNLILRCSWHKLWHDGTRKVPINRTIILKLKLSGIDLLQEKKCSNNCTCSGHKMHICVMNVTGGHD